MRGSPRLLYLPSWVNLMKPKNDILQGTLALLVLRTLEARGPLHGYAMCGGHPAGLGGAAAGRGRIALSRPAPHGAEGWIARSGASPRRAAGPSSTPHAAWTRTARGRTRKLGTPHARRWPRAAVQLTWRGARVSRTCSGPIVWHSNWTTSSRSTSPSGSTSWWRQACRQRRREPRRCAGSATTRCSVTGRGTWT